MPREQVFLFLLIAAGALVDGLRFGPFPITVDTQILFVGKPSILTCNYSKVRSCVLLADTTYSLKKYSFVTKLVIEKELCV